MQLKTTSKLLFVVLFFSCNQIRKKDNCLELEEKLIQENKLKDKEISRLSIENLKLKDRISNIESSSGNFVKREYINFTLTTRSNLVESIFKELDFDKFDFYRQLTNLNGGRIYDDFKEAWVQNSLDVVKFMWHSIDDRSTESIKSLFPLKDRNKFFRFLSNNESYKKSGLAAIVQGLIFTYEEINENEEKRSLFSEFEECLYTNDDENKLISDSPCNEILSEFIATDRVKNLLNGLNYSELRNQQGDFTSERVFYVYSFWARRFQEKNDKLVYNILKDLQNVVFDNPEAFFERRIFLSKFLSTFIYDGYEDEENKSPELMKLFFSERLINNIKLNATHYKPIMDIQNKDFLYNWGNLRIVFDEKLDRACYVESKTDSGCFSFELISTEDGYKIDEIIF